jgi:hypothetical protein
MPRKIRPIRVEGDVAFVPLTQGYEAIIDAADVHLVEGVSWHAAVVRRRDKSVWRVYAQWRGRGKNGCSSSVYLHRVIAGTPDHMMTDHVNGNGLDNRRANLRHATNADNQHNSKKANNNTSGIKGVYWEKTRGKWRAQIKVSGRRWQLGYFTNIEDAAAAYAEASARLHGDFGRTE